MIKSASYAELKKVIFDPSGHYIVAPASLAAITTWAASIEGVDVSKPALDKANQEISTQKALVAEKDRLIVTTNARVSSLSGELDVEKKAHVVSKNSLTAAQASVKRLEEQSAGLTKQISTLNAELSALKGSTTATTEFTKLQQEIAALKKAKGTVDANVTALQQAIRDIMDAIGAKVTEKAHG